MSRENKTMTEERNEQLCVPCSRSDEQESATQFCIECQEYMCDICVKCHKKSKATLQHQITRIDEMRPGEYDRISFSSDELDIQVTCQHHNYKQFKYICRTHKTLCCSRCVIEYHRPCRDVLHLSEYVVHDEYKEKLKSIDCELACTAKKANMLLTYESKHVNMIREVEKTTIENYNVVRDSIIATVQTTFSDRSKAVKANADTIVSSSETLMRDAQLNISKVQQFKDLHEYAKRQGSDASKVATIMSVADHLCTAKQELEKNITKQSTTTLVKEINIDEVRKRIVALNEPKTTRIVGHGLRFNDVPVLVSCIDTPKSASLKECCVLGSGIIVATDDSNKVLRVFDTIQEKEISCFKVSYMVWGIAKINETTIVASLPFEQKVIVLHWKEGTLVAQTAIKTELDCWGLAGYRMNGRDHVAGYSKTKLKLTCIDMMTKETRQVDLDVFERVKANITHVATNSTLGHFYFSCTKEHRIMAFDFDGSFMWQISRNLNSPMGLCVDTRGIINVCSFGTHAIVRVSSRGELENVYVTNCELNGPVAVEFFDKDNFVVCDYDPGNIQMKTFHILRK